jgi:hypothetical protein
MCYLDEHKFSQEIYLLSVLRGNRLLNEVQAGHFCEYGTSLLNIVRAME